MRSTFALLLDPMNTNPPQSSSNDLAAQSAALKGASLAFQKTIAAKSKPKPPPPSPQHNGALVAATSATRDQTPASSPLTRTPRTIGRQTTGSTVKETGHTRDPDRRSPVRNITVQYSGQNRNGSTLTPARSVVDPKSPSFIAATLAASRSGSPAPSSNQAYLVQTPVRVRRKQSIGSQSATSSTIDPEDSETESIRPTGTLISMFEADRSANVDPVKKSSTPMTRAGSPPKISSPLPKAGIITSPVQLFGSSRQSSPLPAPKLRPRTPPPPMRKPAMPKGNTSAKPAPSERLSSTQPVDQSPPRLSSVKQKAPPPIRAPKPQHTISQATIAAYSNAATSAPSSGLGRPASSSSDDTFVSASSTQSPTRRSPRQQPSSPIRASPQTLPPPRRSTAVQRTAPSSSPSRPTTPGTSKARPIASAATSTTTLPLPSLTDAMVASSLASVRASQTPRAPSPPPLPSRRNRGNSLSNTISRIRTQHSGRRQGGASGGVSRHHTGNSSRPPSPVPRTMPLTLRQDRTGEKDKEEEKRRKKTSKGSRRHAHHEGSRKRWREEIREKERKRYEGLWASNRGYLAEYLKPGQGSSESLGLGVQGYEAPEDCVLNIVVRELWRRSRLPDDELAEVWDLVDRTGRGMLGKQEFVVGTWLIDQRLKGRKIPTKVGESVWDSARGWGGGKK